VPWLLALGLLSLAGCTAEPPPPSPVRSSLPAASVPASLRPSTSAQRDTEATIIEEALSDSELNISVDGRLVRLTRDDFLSGSRHEGGHEIVGGGPIPKTTFWFVLGARGQVATAAWVEQRRLGPPTGVYRLPADPLHDLIEIVAPELGSDEAGQLATDLGIEDGELPRPGTDRKASVDGLQFHLIADDLAVFLLATSQSR
jgi:hypothetical protein